MLKEIFTAREHNQRWVMLTWSAVLVTGIAALTAAEPMMAAAVTAQSASAAAGSSVERTIKDPAIVESSGLARSRYRENRLWTHNDSGGGTTIYALGASGRTTAKYDLSGASHKDWEGMASASRNGVSYLFVGDIGDNGKQRSSIFVHRVREPKPAAPNRSLKPATFEFRYPAGAHNAETLMVKPGSLRIYVVTKGKRAAGAVYAAPTNVSTRHVNVLRRVGTAPAGMADGVFLDKQRFILRGYVSGWLYRSVGATAVRFSLPSKGESITTGWHRSYVLVGSEGRYSDIWRVQLP